MNNLIILLLLPLAGALVLAFIKQASLAKRLALFTSLLSLAYTVPFILQFTPDASMQFIQHYAWLPALGINIHLGVDGISLPMLILTNGLIPLIILAAFSYDYKGSFYALILFMQSGLLLVFTALDAFIFYIGWEAALIPIYFICALWGGQRRIPITLKFFVYTFLGSLLMLVAIIYLQMQVPERNFELSSFYQLALSESAQGWLFWAFFLAFAIKMPLVPFHSWQPDTYTVAPTAGTMLLAGIMLKMGTYGVMRWLIPVVPAGFSAYGSLALTLGIVGVVYASIIAFQQNDSKRLIAYSSIAHVGLIGAGIFSWSVSGLQGAIIQMLNHGINVIGLFFVIDVIVRRTQLQDIRQLGGIAKNAPFLAAAFLIIVMGAIGLPITNGFVGEFMLLLGIYSSGIWYAAFGGLTLIFGAVYLLRFYQKTMLGPVSAPALQFTDVKGSERIVLAVVVVLVLAIGIYPQPILNLSEAAVTELINQVTLK